ncbi:MAG: hypothetical protein GVY11_04425 [Gammaproteobacteria bacterium]|jgi:hypothetical protein|nr:hypothetical protein [Gammaproteobacteria bacterium]
MKSSRFATTPDQRLVVHVPQLESLLREAERVPPLIDALVRRGRPLPLDSQSPHAQLATGAALPVAALTRRWDRPDDAEGIWLRADPVGLVPDLAAVWLQTDECYPPGPWREALDEMLAEEGLALELNDQGRGYIRLDAVPLVRFAPPWTLAGNSLEHCLPAGEDARRWRRLLNDTQVILQQHKQGREAADPVPGSLWFWGAGALPAQDSVVPRIRRIVTDGPILSGLAEWLGLPRARFDDPIEPHAGDLVEWPASFAETAQANLEPLQSFLRRAWRQLRLGRIRELELAGLESVRRFTPLDAWRVWR